MTHGEVIILRLLMRRDYYCYQLDKIIEENSIRKWADIGFSSIYSIMNKLEKKNFVLSRYEKEFGSPKRKVYGITPEGRRELKKEVARMLERPATMHDDFTVGLVASDILSEEEVQRCLNTYHDHLKKIAESYRTGIPKSAREKMGVMLAFDRLKNLLEAEISWLSER